MSLRLNSSFVGAPTWRRNGAAAAIPMSRSLKQSLLKPISPGSFRCSEKSKPISPASAFLIRRLSYALYKRGKELATQSEDNQELAKYQEKLNAIEEREPTMRLSKLIDEAVAKENYKDAAKYTKELLKPGNYFALKGFSSSSYRGIVVEASATYMPEDSWPPMLVYTCKVEIRFKSKSDHILKLIDQHWIIDDWEAYRNEIQITESSPSMIIPGKVFKFSRVCCLDSSHNILEGFFEDSRNPSRLLRRAFFEA